MNIIEYTKSFGLFTPVNKTQITSNNINPRGNGRIQSVTNSTGLLSKATINSTGKFKSGNLTSSTQSITDGNLLGKFKANNNLSNKGGKLSFGSKMGIVKSSMTGAAITSSASKMIAKNNAENQALRAGLKPGSPEYNNFVKSKEKAAGKVGKVVGATIGGAIKKNFGTNTYKFK